MLRVVAICAVALGCHLIVAADSDFVQPEGRPSAEAEDDDQKDIKDDELPRNDSFTVPFIDVQSEIKGRAETEEEDQQEQSISCSRPPDIDGVISPVLESEVYPVGTTISYQCKLGYVSRSTGSLLSICRVHSLSGKADWTYPNTTCIPRSCGDPGYVVNGRRIGNLFTFPNNVKFECLEGYKLQGLKNRYCQASGEWSGKLPTCVPIRCPVPSNPKNGRVLYSSLYYGAELEYECDKGLMMQNQQPRICNEDGIWSNDEPECIETSCRIPKAPDFGSIQVYDDPPKVGTLIFYSCDEGTTLVGASTSKCLSSGDWTFDPPQCLRSCYVPNIQDGELGRYQWKTRSREVFISLQFGERVKHNDAVVLRCKDGYSPTNRATDRTKEVECNGGSWSEPLQCYSMECRGEPPSIENGSPMITSRVHGRVIWYKCDDGYEKVKGGKVICEYGRWEGKTPICADYRCHMHELNYPGLLKPQKDFIKHREYFKLICDEAYSVSSSKKHVSCFEGQWDILKRPCIIKTCEDEPPLLKNGKPREYNRVNGSVVDYECEEGYELEGNSTVHCAFGAWDGTPPICKPSIGSLAMTTAEKSESNGETTNSLQPTPDSVEPEECFCTYNYRKDHLRVHSRGTEIESYHRIGKGEKVLFNCLGTNMDIVWPNGLRFYAKVELICDRCRDWQMYELPQCETHVTGIENSGITSTDVSESNSGTTDIIKPTTDAIQSECFCTYDYRNNYLKASSENTEIEVFHRIKKGEKVLFSCQDPNMDIVWPNGLRFYKEIELICNRCRNWQMNDLPQCEARVTGDSFIIYDSLLNLLPGGIIEVSRSERISLACANPWGQPNWNAAKKEGIRFQNGNTLLFQSWFYRQDMIIDEMDYEHAGRYECFARNYDQNLRPVMIDLKVAGFEVLCPKLSTETNQGSFEIVYSDETKVRSRARYKCKDSLKKIVGPAERICLENGKWSRSFPACADILCPPIKESKDVFITYINGRKVNSVAHYSCENVHQKLIGLSNRTCLHSGKWSGTNPMCIDITCPVIPTYNGLSVTYSKGRKVGSTAVFDCSNHATLVGNNVARCLFNETWSHPKPSCEMLEIRCPRLDRKGIFTIQYNNGRRVNGTAQFFCEAPGKKVSGCNFMICQQNGEWSGDYPTCVDYESCDLFSNPPNLTVRYTNAGGVGSVASFHCLPPAYLVGSSFATCHSNGIWSHSLPTCAAPNCSIETLQMSLPENLYPNLVNETREFVTPGSELPLLCEEHLVLKGSSVALCNFQGKWEFSDAQCITACRVNKDEASHLIVEPMKDFYAFGEFILLSCPPGQKLTSEVERMMCLGKTWSDTLPDCTQLTEPNPTGFTHASVKPE